MFVHHIEFEVVAEKERQWEPYMRNFHAVEARMPGGVLFRVLRRLDEPHRFISLRTWLSKEDSKAAFRTSDLDLAARPAQQDGFYRGKQATWTQCELLDFVWGPEGPSGYAAPELFARYAVRDVPPEKLAPYRAYSRNFLSVMARQKGFVSGEVLRPAGPAHRFISVLMFRARDRWPIDSSAEPSAEVRMAFEAGRATRAYEGSSPLVALNTAVFDAAWGREGAAAYQRFIDGLEPAS